MLTILGGGRGETLEKRPWFYLVEVVLRPDDAFPRRRSKEPSMSPIFRSMPGPMKRRGDPAAAPATWAAQARAALRAVFSTRGAEEAYLSQASDLSDLEQRQRCAERGQAPYQRAWTFHAHP